MENVFSQLLVSVYEAKISRREKEEQTNNKEKSNCSHGHYCMADEKFSGGTKRKKETACHQHAGL